MKPSEHRRRPFGRAILLIFFILLAGGLFVLPEVAADDPPLSATPTPSKYIYLPLVGKTATCPSVSGAGFGSISTYGGYPSGDPPAESHADLNLGLRGYRQTDKYLGMVHYNGGTDSNAPQLPYLFNPERPAVIPADWQVYQWDWNLQKPKTVVESAYEVNLISLTTQNGENVHVPDSGYSIGSGYEVMVLYAEEKRITLEYTRKDNVIDGYTIHLENVCVDPNLLALYQQLNSQGRSRLPALTGKQALGTAIGPALLVSVRDRGSWMDPRSCKDWWQKYNCAGAQLKLGIMHSTGSSYSPALTLPTVTP